MCDVGFFFVSLSDFALGHLTLIGLKKIYPSHKQFILSFIRNFRLLINMDTGASTITSKEALTKVLEALSAEDRATVEQAIATGPDIEAAARAVTEPGPVLNVVHKGSLIVLTIFFPVGLAFLLMGLGAVPRPDQLILVLGESQVVFFIFGLNMIFGVAGSYGVFGTTKFARNLSTISTMFLISMFLCAMLRHHQIGETVLPPLLFVLVAVAHLCSGPPATRDTHSVCKPCSKICKNNST